MIALAAITAYLIGSVPTAAALGRFGGVDLRRQGSGNPGANNALRLRGPLLAGMILLVEMAKGLGAVLLGNALGGDPGAMVAGLAAAAGNVYNVWYGLDGGKGLGITAGALVGLWPTVVAPAIALIATAAIVTRSSGAAAVIALGGLNVMAVGWLVLDIPMGWGIQRDELLVAYTAGLAMILWRKHWRDASFSRGHRRASPEPESPGRH